MKENIGKINKRDGEAGDGARDEVDGKDVGVAMEAGSDGSPMKREGVTRA